MLLCETSTREWSERTVMQDADLGGSEELRSSLDIFTSTEHDHMNRLAA